MELNHLNLTEVTGIFYLILGIANLIGGEYIPGVAWTSLSISQFIVQTIGDWSSNMFRLERPEVIFAWVTYLIFAFLILYYVLNLLIKSK
ncbi:MAG: hypothetical protein VKL59_09000 [Nostocaceae cyanobacterium]|nr:hypothetical protein [Nostocaceae cyanobacterium]